MTVELAISIHVPSTAPAELIEDLERRVVDLDQVEIVVDATCRVCGCTDDSACFGGCAWVDDSPADGGYLCTACAGAES